jgi:hypothetical protein
MNYRRNKAEYAFAKEKQEWQLQRTAIEQFNGLRRELFNTAWRLADTYNFPDEYRLAEKQIKQYNQILIDQDEIRKYERLESIKDNFEAYPPFWYFIGNAANYIAENKDMDVSEETRNLYRKKALEYFEKYEETNKFNLLREDQIAASCYLEHIDILLTEKSYDNNKIEFLLHEAIKISGKANDILELCAIDYLKINNKSEASKLLRILVNEDYNRVINGQLLSGIYVQEHNRADYELLTTRVDSDYLYPMPKDDSYDASKLEEEFGSKLKDVLKVKYKMTFENLLQKYSIEWNKLTSVFDLAVEYEDDFFLDSPKANAMRRDAARQVLCDECKKQRYAERAREANYELGILDILNRLYKGLFNFTIFKNSQVIEEVENEIKNQILDKKDDINSLQKTMDNGDFALDSYNFSQTITLKSIVGRTFRALNRYADSVVERATVNEISSMEADLRKFCINENLAEPEIEITNSTMDNSFGSSSEIFGAELFGHRAIVARENAKFLSDMANFIKEKLNAINLKDDSLAIYFLGDSEFSSIFYDTSFESFAGVQSHAIMVLKDKSKKCTDLIFTTNGIVHIVKGKVKNLTPYKEVELKNNQIILFRNFKYSTSALDMLLLFNVIKDLGGKFLVGVEDKTEYLAGTVNSATIVQWFKSNKSSMDENVTRIIAIPTKELLEHLGYKLDAEFDKDRNLIQFYYDNKTNDVLNWRIIRYENIDSNLQAKLLENNGFLKVTLN